MKLHYSQWEINFVEIRWSLAVITCSGESFCTTNGIGKEHGLATFSFEHHVKIGKTMSKYRAGI